MLHFFRKYQKYFFVVIILSFVFFGTYQAFVPSQKIPDEVRLTTLRGQKIKNSYLTALGNFLSEEHDRHTRGNFFNFLNNGVFSKDILETGVGLLLYQAYEEQLLPELQAKFQREKCFSPYAHPQAPFISAEAIWGIFAPQISEKLKSFKSLDNPSGEAFFQARNELYLAERRFPPSYLTQVLHYQLRDYPQLGADPRLYREDLSLFSYRDLRDWFGASFIDCVSQFVIQCAEYAQTKGYSVTKEEVLSEIHECCQKAFHGLKQQLPSRIATSHDLYYEYLRQMGMDENTLVRIWKDITLFRKIFDDLGSAALVDTLPLKQFYSCANEYATIELVQLPVELRLKTYDDLKLFEAYLEAVCPKRNNPLEIPNAYLSAEAIEKKAPELIGKRYTIEYAKVTRKELEAKPSIKQVWEWEIADANWGGICKEFPGFGLKSTFSKEERVRAIEELADASKEKLDSYAKGKIVKEHPEWISEALAAKTKEEKTLFLKMKHTGDPLDGIQNSLSLQQLLEEKDEISQYTQDDNVYYAFLVKNRGQKELVSLLEAKKEGVLKGKECQSLLKAIYKDAKAQGLITKEISEDKLAEEVVPYRFAAYLRDTKEEDLLWNFVKKQETITRSSPSLVSLDDVSAMKPQEISKVLVSSDQGAYFYKFLDKKVDTTVPLDTLLQAQDLLAKEIKLHFARELIGFIQEKKGIVLNPIVNQL